MSHTVHKLRRSLVVTLCLGLLVVALGALSASADTTIVVQPMYTTTAVPANVCPGLEVENWTNGWATCDENTTTSPGSVTLAAGPDTPPLGTGSAHFNVNGSTNGPYMSTVFQNGLRLDAITQLTYQTYYATGDGDNNRPVLQLNVDYDLTDSATNWQGRLIWIPKWAGCVTLIDDTWQTLDPMNNTTGCWLQTGTPRVSDANVAPLYPHTGGTAATWDQILNDYPNAGIHGTLGAIGFKIGSGESAGKASLDNFKFGISTGGGEDVTTWDFDPDVPCTTTCYADAVNGNDLNGGTSPTDAKKTIQAAITAVDAGGQVIVAPGTYAEKVTIPKSLTLTGSGNGTDPAEDTILEGTSLSGRGIFINSNVEDVTIEDLRVQNFKSGAASGIYANGQNDGLIVQNIASHDNGIAGAAEGGIFMNGPVDDVLIDSNTVTNNRSRGIVIWNGFKTNITITNNTVSGNNCCGIELQDGTASGVTVTDNTVTGNSDSGMAFIGLMAGAGPNLIADNTVTDNGRFGIEIKLPNGTGQDNGDGSIVVEGNVVSLTSTPADLRDYAGIAAIRRGWVEGNNNVDIPTGVVIRNNTVSGYAQANGASSSTGFGIVVEGTNMHVSGNTLNNNDVGLQVQAGHTPYTANSNVDGNQNNVDDYYFGRGNSPIGCVALGSNTFSANTIDTLNVGAGGGNVTNVDTGEHFCTIQSAINDTDTQNNHTLEVSAGTFPEAVTVNKELTIIGDSPTTTIIDPPSGNGFNISANNVTLEGVTMTGGTSGASISGARSNITFENVRVVGNTSYGIPISNNLTAASNIQVLNSYFSGGSIGIRMSSTTIVDGLLIEGSTFENQNFGFYQANDSNQGHVKNLRVTDNSFTNLSTHAVYMEEASDVEVDNNTFTGNFSGVYLYDGYDSTLQSGFSGNIDIHDNTFTDHKYAAVRVRAVDNDADSDIYGLNNPFNVYDNTFNQDIGAFNTGNPSVTVSPVIEVTLQNGGTHGTVNVTDNTFTFSGDFEPVTTAAYGVMVRGGVDTVNITGNTIGGGTPATTGVYVVSNHSTYGPLGATSVVNVSKNLINDLPDGVVVYDEVAAAYGGIPAGAQVSVTRNDLSDITGYGIQSGPSTESGGTCNWWGDASGPGGVGLGTGTDVSTDVDFTPWLFSANLDSDCYVPGTITVVKETNPDGDTTPFTFDPSWGANFTLSDGQSLTSPALNPDDGPFSVAEINLPANWAQTDASCTNGIDTADPSNIELDQGETWTCTFENDYTQPVGRLYISPNKKKGTIGGVPFTSGDILVNIIGTNNWAMHFDGSDVGLKVNLTDYVFLDDGCMLMTFNGNFKIKGFWTFLPQDIAKFCPTSTGENTAGTWEVYFDGSDVGLKAGPERIDGLAMTPDGDLIISTKGNFNLKPADPMKGKKNELLRFTPTSLGENTAGTWTLFYSNATVIPKKANPLSLDLIDGNIYMSIWGKKFVVGGVPVDDNDVFYIDPNTNDVTVFWDGDLWGYNFRIMGLHITYD